MSPLKHLRHGNSPLSGSGVVQFLCSLCLSSLRDLSGSGLLESLCALLFKALCSSLRMRPWDRLMKSGLKSSKASWCGGCKAEEWSEQLVRDWTNTAPLIAAYAEARGGGCMYTVLKCSVEASLIRSLTLEKSSAQPSGRRWGRDSNIMPSSLGRKVKAWLNEKGKLNSSKPAQIFTTQSSSKKFLNIFLIQMHGCRENVHLESVLGI